MSRTGWSAVLIAFVLGVTVGWFGNGGDQDATQPGDRAKFEDDLARARQESARLRDELEALHMEQAAAEAGAAQAVTAPMPEASATAAAPPADDAKREAAKRKLADLEYRLSADPANPTLLAEYVRTAALAGEHDAAIDRIKALVAEHPDNADLITWLGRAYLGKIRAVEKPLEKGRLAFTALGEFGKALEKDETHFEARWYRAVVRYHMPPFLGKIDESIQDLETMVEQSGGTAGDARYARVYTLLGRAYRKAGRTEDAKKAFDRGLALFPGDAGLTKEAGTGE